MQTFHGGQHDKHTMLLNDISNLFDTALEKFDPISGQSMDSHLAELRGCCHKSSFSSRTTSKT